MRVADEDDFARLEELEQREAEALSLFRELVTEHKLDMKPIDVEYLLDGDKIVFYFSAEERVDFRELVRELASQLHARIDMRQVGVRDEARAVGGIGHCGQMLCCVRFGGDFQPVSIRMAKEQDLPLNPLKISGLCGRLMCCLRYEFDAYKDFKGRAPKKGAVIDTAVGLAKVTELNTPRETIGMRFEDGSRVTVPLAEMTCGRGGACPCQVGREALEAAGNAAALAMATEEQEPPAPEPVLKSERERPGKPAAKAPKEPKAEKPAEKTGSGGRRRRRRGGGGESGAAGAEGAPKAEQGQRNARQGQQPKAEPSAQGGESGGQQDAGAESGSAGRSAKRRRRRRRPGGGGSASE